MLRRGGAREHGFSFPTFGGKRSVVSPLPGSVTLSVGVSQMPLVLSKKFPFTPSSMSTFTVNGAELHQMLFLHLQRQSCGHFALDEHTLFMILNLWVCQFVIPQPTLVALLGLFTDVCRPVRTRSSLRRVLSAEVERADPCSFPLSLRGDGRTGQAGTGQAGTGQCQRLRLRGQPDRFQFQLWHTSPRGCGCTVSNSVLSQLYRIGLLRGRIVCTVH